MFCAKDKKNSKLFLVIIIVLHPEMLWRGNVENNVFAMRGLVNFEVMLQQKSYHTHCLIISVSHKFLFYSTTDNMDRSHHGVVVKLLALETRGLGFDPWFLQSF